MRKILIALFLLLSFAAYAQQPCEFPPVVVNQNLSCDTCICGKDTIYVIASDTNAVYVLDHSNPGASVTGTTTETQLYSFMIPANKLKVGDVISFTARVSKIGTAGTMEHRVRFGTANNTTDAQIARYDNIAGVTWVQWQRFYLLVQSPTNLAVFSVGTPSQTDINSGSGTNVTIDITVNQWMSFTGKLGNSGDRYILDAQTTTVSPAP